jgi:hypothetical protein
LNELVKPVANADHLLRWWQQHQAEWLNQEADAIRNGLLQDLFAVRRKLELLNGEGESCVADIEQLYYALRNLGDRLSSPFVEDSLPLAIRHLLSDWEGKLPISADLPDDWSQEPLAQIALLLSILTQMLQTLEAQACFPRCCRIRLAAVADRKHCSLRVEYDSTPPPPLLAAIHSEDWLSRLQIFEIITLGQTSLTPGETSLEWQFSW